MLNAHLSVGVHSTRIDAVDLVPRDGDLVIFHYDDDFVVSGVIKRRVDRFTRAFFIYPHFRAALEILDSGPGGVRAEKCQRKEKERCDSGHAKPPAASLQQLRRETALGLLWKLCVLCFS